MVPVRYRSILQERIPWGVRRPICVLAAFFPWSPEFAGPRPSLSSPGPRFPRPLSIMLCRSFLSVGRKSSSAPPRRTFFSKLGLFCFHHAILTTGKPSYETFWIVSIHPQPGTSLIAFPSHRLSSREARKSLSPVRSWTVAPPIRFLLFLPPLCRRQFWRTVPAPTSSFPVFAF